MELIFSPILNIFADGLGAMAGGMWGVSRRVRKLGKNAACPQCNVSLSARPRIYRSTSYPMQTSWRKPSIIAEYRCANCGRSVRFLLTDTDLQLIGPSGKFMGSVEFSAKENHGARQRPLSTDPRFEITLDGQ